MAHEWQLHVSEVIQTEGPKLFEALGKHFKKNADEFNSAFGENRLGCDVSLQRIKISIKRETEVTLALELKGIVISAELREVASYNVDQSEKWGIPFQVDRESRLLVGGSADLEKLAQGLLDRTFKGIFSSRR